MLLDGVRIFYIEDDLFNRTIARTILEAHGAEMTVDPWGYPEITINKMIRFQPHIILLDLMLPNQTTGYEIFAAIQRRSNLSRIPCVAVSAADASVEIPKTQAKGFKGFISKPLDINLFPNQIAAVLKGETVWHST